MRKVFGLISLALAGLLLMLSVLAMSWIPGQVKKTPLGIDTKTYLTGEASALPAGGSSPVQYFSHTVADPEKSTDEVVAFSTFTCLTKVEGANPPDCVDDKDPKKRLVNAGTDRFATDRKSALALEEGYEEYVGEDAEPHTGLVNKFPFDVEKKTYPFWDGVLGRAVDAEFQGEEQLDGLDTYVFRVASTDEPAEIAKDIDGIYSSTKDVWVDPVTGSMIKQHERQERKLENGQTVLALDIAFTDETVAANVADTKESVDSLSMIDKLPPIAAVLGLLFGLLGLFLLLGRRGDQPARGDDWPRDDNGDLGVFDSADEPTRRRSDIHRD